MQSRYQNRFFSPKILANCTLQLTRETSRMGAVDRVVDSLRGLDLSRSQKIEILNEFGTLLRNPDIRSNDEVRNSIPQLAKITNDAVSVNDSELLLEVFRVWINLTADSDLNRDCLANMTTDDLALFWNNVARFNSQEDSLKERVVLFLTQFIHNTERANEFTTFLHNAGITPNVIDYIISLDSDEDVENTFDAVSDGFELVSEITKHVKAEEFWMRFNIQQFNSLVGKVNELVSLADNDVPIVGEVFDYISSILYNVTLLEDSDKFGDVGAIYSILENLPQNLENITLINRRIFSAIGNITSMPAYDNTKDTDFNISILINPRNKYSAAAASIALGNCVHSQETKEALIDKIRSRMPVSQLIEKFFAVEFNDIIMYQAFHLLNNAMNKEIASFIIGNDVILARLTTINKAIVDNSKYYKEVSQIYFKFLRKLVKFGYLESNGSNISSLLQIWQYLENNETKLDTKEVFLLLLQAFATNFSTLPPEFGKMLLNTAFGDSHMQNVPVHVVLEKLKTIGIVLQTFSKNSVTPAALAASLRYGTDFTTQFLEPYTRFLTNLHESIQATPTADQQSGSAQVLQNNFKFVAASTITWLQGPLTPETLPVVEICHQILA